MDKHKLPSASIVVVSYNTADHIMDCIESLQALHKIADSCMGRDNKR